ncbi:Aste57867_11016 [Aphanomyces stellatus]|uniref:Aste57867_11016 protein n=1 Tax=Aphanomyces stellatus TaxID=120398 RepID=A0A485KSJ1_9STRA|nr:hypothetical protein As57867_010975 [Aphanomyces stellatus]VFT87884.1 Aste57867_11016 [Aphanomyces stellatus]
MTSLVAYTISQVDNCRFTAWYENLRDESILSIAIPLPEEFIRTLLEDKIQVDEELYPDRFVDAVKESIKTLGGSVFVKLDWSSPRDAKWMLGNSLRCRTFEDIVVLLKSSDFISHDLTEVYEGCVDKADHVKSRPETFHLVLKKWCNFYDSMHFRCFVVDGSIVGISQRNCTEFYDFLQNESTQENLCNAIESFFKKNFKSDYEFSDPNFIFDVYIDKNNRVFLLDINVFGCVTDGLLFNWEELHQLQMASLEDNIDFRVVTSEKMAYCDPYSQYRVPLDLVDHLSTPGGFDDFIRQVAQDNARKLSHDDSDSSSSETD